MGAFHSSSSSGLCSRDERQRSLPCSSPFGVRTLVVRSSSRWVSGQEFTISCISLSTVKKTSFQHFLLADRGTKGTFDQAYKTLKVPALPG